jgi:hypothetical protein
MILILDKHKLDEIPAETYYAIELLITLNGDGTADIIRHFYAPSETRKNVLVTGIGAVVNNFFSLKDRTRVANTKYLR